jgi:hypothetical protein
MFFFEQERCLVPAMICFFQDEREKIDVPLPPPGILLSHRKERREEGLNN